jgi:hypothetical protein
MPENRNGHRTDDSVIVERAVVLQVLADDPQKWWSPAMFDRELSDVAPDAVDDALFNLERAGVIEHSRQSVCVSRAARRLDELGLIGM